MSATSGDSGSRDSTNFSTGREPLFLRYPVNSVMELLLSPERQIIRGLIYCTDEASNVVVLKRSLAHTTLSSEIRLVNVSCVIEEKVLRAADADDQKNEGAESATDNEAVSEGYMTEVAREKHHPLSVVSKRVLREREKRAIRLSEETFRHINQKATPNGQAVFDRLLKACNVVSWCGESILVLNQIQVDPPYKQEDCRLVCTPADGEGGLERVKKIVAATSC